MRMHVLIEIFIMIGRQGWRTIGKIETRIGMDTNRNIVDGINCKNLERNILDRKN